HVTGVQTCALPIYRVSPGNTSCLSPRAGVGLVATPSSVPRDAVVTAGLRSTGSGSTAAGSVFRETVSALVLSTVTTGAVLARGVVGALVSGGSADQPTTLPRSTSTTASTRRSSAGLLLVRYKIAPLPGLSSRSILLKRNNRLRRMPCC